MTTTEIETIKLDLDALTVKFDKMEKQMKKILKIVKKTEPDVEDTPKRQNSLAKPIDISDPLKQFMGLPKDGQSSRNDVTRFINTYIRENGLQHNEKNKREFILDDKLAKVIVPEDGIVLSFFNYQKYMKHCFLQPADTDTRKKEPKAGTVAKKEPKAGAVAKEPKAGGAIGAEDGPKVRVVRRKL